MINEIRGLSLEYESTAAPGAAKVKQSLCAVMADSANELTPSSRECMKDLYDELIDVEARVKKLDKKIRHICKQNETCRRILKTPGVGELTATAIVAAIPNANEFKNGRQMLAWFGLVLRQSSSGDKQVLLGIIKRGDRYLPTLLIHRARAALSHYKATDNDYEIWLARKKATLCFNKTAVALANKNARIIWSLLKTGEEFNYGVQTATDTQFWVVSYNSMGRITSLLLLILVMANRLNRLFKTCNLSRSLEAMVLMRKKSAYLHQGTSLAWTPNI